MDTVAEPLTLPAAVPVADPIEPLPFRVVGVRPELLDVVTVRLAPVVEALPLPRPGQFVMVWVPGLGEIPLSVSGVGDGGQLLLTVQSVGAVSAGFVALTTGDVVGVRGPYGTEWPLTEGSGRDVFVVAGGLGLAPLRMAIDALVADSPLRVTVVVGAREPSRILFPGDLARWSKVGVKVHETVDAAGRHWHGGVGTTSAMVDRLADLHEVAYICGPERMMTTTARAAMAKGVPPHRLWVSLERNMHCGVGHCGRCQLGPLLLCRDGAVARWDEVAELLEVRGR